MDDEERLSGLCDDAEALFKLIDSYWEWAETATTYPPGGEDFGDVKMEVFLKEALGCPEKLTTQLVATFRSSLLAGNVVPPYFEFAKWFWGSIETWSHRKLPELQITHEVSEPIRKRLIPIHQRWVQERMSKKNFNRPFWSSDANLLTLYWLTPPNWRNQFFQTWIKNSEQLNTVVVEPGAIIPLLKPTDNLAFYFWCLETRKKKVWNGIDVFRLSIWEELQRLVLDEPLRNAIFYDVTGWDDLEHQGTTNLNDRRLMQLLGDFNDPWMPDFNSHPIAIQRQDHLNWLREYVALGLECDVPIWDSLFFFLYYNQPSFDE